MSKISEAKKVQLRNQAERLFNTNPEGKVIELVVNDTVYGDYEIPVNHFITIDSKDPKRWINECLCFLELKGVVKPKLSLRVRT
jgi:hypothetical protein